MTTVVNVYEAKTQLSKLLEQVERGEEVVIARAGRPIARLSTYGSGGGPRRLGLAAGKVTIHPGFDEDDEDIIAMFEGSDTHNDT